MRFVSYSQLVDALGSSDQLKTSTGREKAIQRLDPTNPKQQEIIVFISALTDEQLVFIQWIEQNKSLKILLERQIPDSGFADGLNWKNHGLFERFSQFLSPYLIPVLLKLSPELNLSLRARLFSFATLLPKEDRSLIDRDYFGAFRREVEKQLALVEQASSEEELLKLTDGVTNDDFIQAVNCLSRAAYNERVHYIDAILRTVKHPHCTARLAGRILRKLELIDLNPEHKQKIRELEHNRKKGHLVSAKRKRTLFTKVHRKTWLGMLFFVLLIASALYLILEPKKPLSTTEDLNLQSSFEQFSQEERKKIDSLLRLRQKEAVQEDVDQDQYLWTQGNGVSMAIRKPLQNMRMERLYSDWVLNAELHFNKQISDCKAYDKTSAFTFPGIGDLQQENGDQMLTIRNESDYTVAFYSFQEKINGKVNMTLIKRGSQITVNVNREDHLLFVAGNDPAQFDPKNATGNLPSTEFTSHFCTVDDNLSASLSTIYKLALPSAQRNKLMLRGDSTESFFVADLYGILETIW
jgi:hypothetical protein